METVHLWLFELAVALTAAVLILAAAGLAGRLTMLWLDRLILADLAAIVLAALIGPLLLGTGHQPRDLLHLLYGAVAVLALPVGRYVARSGSPRRRAAAMAIAALVLLGLLARLLMTGS